MIPIEELEIDDSETKTKREDSSDDEGEEDGGAFGRSGEQIDLKTVDVTPSRGQGKKNLE